MSNYKIKYFVIPVSIGDHFINIRDNRGEIRHTIDPESITIMFIKLNTINIRTKLNSVIVLDFTSEAEAKLALLELQQQIDIINNKHEADEEKENELIEKIDKGIDFLSIYQSEKLTGTHSTTHSELDIDERLELLIAQVADDVTALNSASLLEQYIANPGATFSEAILTHSDVLNHTFNFNTVNTTIYINGILLNAGNTINDIAVFSADNLTTMHSKIVNNSKLYINTSLLGYDLDLNDTISILYQK